MTTHKQELAKIIGKALFYSSIIAAIGSVLMSSVFSVVSFSKDQDTLQRAADALRSFLVMAVIWSMGTVLALYASYGNIGMWAGVISCAIMTGWIFFGYVCAFKTAAKAHNLKYPVIFKWDSQTTIPLIVVAAISVWGVYYLRQP